MEKVDEYEPTDEEERNGWTKETLRAYHESRQRQQAKTIYTKKQTLPNEQNHRYQPHKWRR